MREWSSRVTWSKRACVLVDSVEDAGGGGRPPGRRSSACVDGPGAEARMPFRVKVY